VSDLGLCGVGAAITNAICHATGMRVREHPITLERFLQRLPEVG
jgi:xanthine dehydrogenase YagR molybdenum-binding subunit